MDPRDLRQRAPRPPACVRRDPALRGRAPLEILIGFPQAGAGGRIGRWRLRVRECLGGLRERPFPAAWRRPCVSRTASRVAGPRDAASLPESSRSPVPPRGSAGTAAWPDRGPARPSPPARPGARYAAPPASPDRRPPSCWRRAAQPAMKASASTVGMVRRRISVPPRRTGARGSIVAIGDAVARLGSAGPPGVRGGPRAG